MRIYMRSLMPLVHKLDSYLCCQKFLAQQFHITEEALLAYNILIEDRYNYENYYNQ